MIEQTRANRLSPLRCVIAFGVVSLLADFVYEGVLAISGPYLATWGLGIHESTMRAGIADLVPAERSAAGYGTLATLYGLNRLVGSFAIGALYDVAPARAIAFAIGNHFVALIIFIPLSGNRQ